MEETITLRNKPELKFVFNDEGFDIIDVQDSETNNGSYLTNDLESIEYIKRQTDWLVTLLSIFTSTVGNYKNQAHMKLFFRKSPTLKIWLNSVNTDQIDLLKKRLDIKKATT